MNVFHKMANQLRYYGKNLEKRRELRMEVSRLASMANKRVQRLANNDLTETPAYQRYMKDGGERFGVQGKESYNEIQSEIARLRRFIEAESSTVRGAHKVLKKVAKSTGISYKSMKDLKAKSAKFFELASKVQQYMDNMERVASDIGYQKIWEAINVYVKKEKVDLGASEDRIDEMVKAIDKYILESQKNIPGPVPGRFFKLKK